MTYRFRSFFLKQHSWLRYCTKSFICVSDEDNGAMLQCGNCKYWYHLQCEGKKIIIRRVYLGTEQSSVVDPDRWIHINFAPLDPVWIHEVKSDLHKKKKVKKCKCRMFLF
jgi:hypothetical protein